MVMQIIAAHSSHLRSVSWPIVIENVEWENIFCNVVQIIINRVCFISVSCQSGY